MSPKLKDLAETIEIATHVPGYWKFSDSQLEFLIEEVKKEFIKNMVSEMKEQEDNLYDDYERGVLAGLEKAKDIINKIFI
jgi:hypothetical protein